MRPRSMAFSGALLILGALALGTAALGQTSAADELKQVISGLRSEGANLTAEEYAARAERAFLAFGKKHAAEPEGALAHLYLGSIFVSIGSHEKAAREIEAYLRAPVEKKPAELAQAKYFAGSTYLALERFDEAEKALSDVVEMGSSADARLVQMASVDMERIPTLRKLKSGNPAPEISVVSSKGLRIKLSEYRGKVVLLDFWAAWCMPCRMEMPNVIEVYEKHHPKGFEIIGVSLDSDRGQFESFVKTNAMTWPQIYDGKKWDSEVGRLYGVTSIPATYLIDKQGKIRYHNLRGEQLAPAVERLLGEK